MATITRGFRRTTFEASWEQPIELGVTLLEPTSRWSRFVGQRCLLEPGEHVGRKVEIAWRRSDHPRDCQLIDGSGCERRIVAHTHYTVTLNAAPDVFLGGANPVIIFHAEKQMSLPTALPSLFSLFPITIGLICFS